MKHDNDSDLSRRPIHICQSPDCGCGLTRRDFLRISALGAASIAACQSMFTQIFVVAVLMPSSQ